MRAMEAIGKSLHNRSSIETATTCGCYQCVAGQTKIATVFDGIKTIEWLVKHKAGQRLPVYCFDFDKMDYTIGWAFDPRYVKNAETVKILLDDGDLEVVTPDHRILRRNGVWAQAGQLKDGDELMPFYKISPIQGQTKQRYRQFPRIYTHLKGWIHERQFIDEWRLGRDLPEYEDANKACRMIHAGMKVNEIMAMMKHDWHTIQSKFQREGFSLKEMRYLARKKPDRRRVIGIHRSEAMPVYDLSVDRHENFCTGSVVMHNCSKVFDPKEVKNWTFDDTAICPLCGNEAVIPDVGENDLHEIKKFLFT